MNPSGAHRVDSILAHLEGLGIRLGLDKMRQLLGDLGHPERAAPAVLVAGSNGKGSTSALLAAIVQAAGYRTGLYTSPHLERVEERLQIDGRAIAADRLADLLEKILAAASAAGEEPPTYFEAITLAAFLWFAEERVDLAVLEVGLGGRLDATNVAEPILSLVTSISLEHTDVLGDTLAAVAREKAGIFRPGRWALTAVEAGEPLAALETEAARLGTRLARASERARIEAHADRGLSGQSVEIATATARHHLDLALAGEHQRRNLALALAAAESLSELGFPHIDAAAIARGVAACRWPGRIETLTLPGGQRVVLDAAHNPEGAESLARFLADVGEPFDLLVGILGDKDAAAMLPQLAAAAGDVVLTAPPSPRARDPHELAALLPASIRAEVIPDLGAALDRALAASDRTLVVCGSIFLIGEVRRRLRERFEAERSESKVRPPEWLRPRSPYISGS